MNWQVQISSMTPAITIAHARNENAIKVGANYFVDEDAVYGTINNNIDQMVIDPHIAYATRAAAQAAYVGKHVIFDEGNNNKYGEVISDVLYSSGYLRGFVFASNFSVAPMAGTRFHILSPAYNIFRFKGKNAGMVHFDKEIQNITFETDINIGYSKATVQLNQLSAKVGRIYNEMVGKILEIIDPTGVCVYYGLVYSTSISAESASISATSFMDTFSWYYLRDIIWPAGTQIAQAFKDVVSTNPYLNYVDQYSSIAPGPTTGTLYTLSSTQYGSYKPWANYGALAEIGPLEFDDAEYTAQEILDRLLENGFLGTGANSGMKVALQVWNEGIPTIRAYPRVPPISSVQYGIQQNNFKYSYEGLNLLSDLSDTESQVYTSYTDEDGERFRAASVYDITLTRRFPFKGELFTAELDTQGTLFNAMQAIKLDKSQVGGPGSITLTGKVRGHVGTPSVPVWKLKAGDVASFDFSLSQVSNLYRSYDSSPGVFIIGSTSYDVASQAMTITNYQNVLWRDLFNARIRV